MGNDSSTPIPPPPSDGLPLFSITLTGSLVRDSLYLHYCRQSEILIILDCIRENYPPGISSHQPMVEYGYKIKLNGSPFEHVLAGGTSQSIWARRLLADIFLKLGRRGWIPLVSSDLRRLGDTATIFFEYKPEMARIFQDSHSVAVVGIHCSTELQIINIDGGLAQLLFDVVCKSWHKKVTMKSKTTDKKNKFDPITVQVMDMEGSPWGWTTNESEAIHGRLSILRIIETMASQGWRLILNCNIRPLTDTLFFLRDPLATAMTMDFRIGANMFGMGLHKMDELRFVGRLPNDNTWQHLVVQSVSTVINSHWPQGLKRSEQKDDFYVLEMHGTPWWADGTNAVQARLMFAKILEALMSLGWMVKSTIDCSRKDNDKHSCFFERCNPINTSVVVLSFNESDKIRAINCPKNLVENIDRAISQQWIVQRRRQYGSSEEWKLKGNPWDWGHWQNKALAVNLLYTLYQSGYVLLCSIDTSAKFVHQENGPDYPLDVHSWYLITKEAHSALKSGAAAAGAGAAAAADYLQPPPYYSEAPPPYACLVPSANVTPVNSRPTTPEKEQEPSAPPLEPYGVPQWGSSLYPKL